MSRAELLDRLAGILAARRPAHPLRVAIDGIDAVGKTSFADELGAVLTRIGRQVIRASSDGFHRPRADRYRQGTLSPTGYFQDSFDYTALHSCLLDPLGPGGCRRFRRSVFDHHLDIPARVAWEVATGDEILLCDGVFLLREELRSAWDVTLLLTCDPAVARARGLARDGRSGADPDELARRYDLRYGPGQRIYFSDSRPETRADCIIENDDYAAPRITRWPPTDALERDDEQG